MLYETGLEAQDDPDIPGVAPLPWQEWKNSAAKPSPSPSPLHYCVSVRFQADVFGAFKRCVVFSFGAEPFLFQELSVAVEGEAEEVEGAEAGSEEDDEELRLFRAQLVKQDERWDETNSDIIDFTPPVIRVRRDRGRSGAM